MFNDAHYWKVYTAPLVDACVWGNGGMPTAREKQKLQVKNLSQCQFANHKSDRDWPGIKPGLNSKTTLL